MRRALDSRKRRLALQWGFCNCRVILEFESASTDGVLRGKATSNRARICALNPVPVPSTPSVVAIPSERYRNRTVDKHLSVVFLICGSAGETTAPCRTREFATGSVSGRLNNMVLARYRRDTSHNARYAQVSLTPISAPKVSGRAVPLCVRHATRVVCAMMGFSVRARSVRHSSVYPVNESDVFHP
jgi:hypothetical protein